MAFPDVLTLRGVAARMGVTYGWLQRHWRTLAGFPPPFVGAEPGQSPRWALSVIDDYKTGRRWSANEPATVAPSLSFPVANDTVRAPISDPVAALLAAAGG